MKVIKLVNLTPGQTKAYTYFKTLVANFYSVLTPLNLRVEGKECGYYPLYEAFYYVASKLYEEFEAAPSDSKKKEQKFKESLQVYETLKLFITHLIPNELGKPRIDVAQRLVFFEKFNDPARINPIVHVTGFEEVSEKELKTEPRDYLFFEEFILLDYYFKFIRVGADFEEKLIGTQRALSTSTNNAFAIGVVSLLPLVSDVNQFLI